MSSIFARYPALVVEFGAAAVLVAALLARALSRRFGIPSIITLLAVGLALGPSGLNFLQLDLAAPATRALLSLCVVIVLFEATLRIDIGRLPKRPLFLLVIFGAGLTLIVIPVLYYRLVDSRRSEAEQQDQTLVPPPSHEGHPATAE